MSAPTTSLPAGLQTARLIALASLLKRLRRVIATQIQGSSMASTIADKAWIRIQCAENPPCTPGQIVAFMAGSTLVVHRVMYCGRRGRAQQYLITQGDGMGLPDLPVQVDAVMGVVIAVQGAEGWHPPALPGPFSPQRRPWARLVLGMICLVLECHVTLARQLVRGLRLLRLARSGSSTWLISRTRPQSEL